MGTAAAALGANAAKDQAVYCRGNHSRSPPRIYFRDQPNTIRDTLQSSFVLQLPTLDLNDIRGQFEKNPGADLQSLAGRSAQNIDRQTFVDLVSSRTDFFSEQINGIADQLEGAWEVLGQQGSKIHAQLLNFLSLPVQKSYSRIS